MLGDIHLHLMENTVLTVKFVSANTSLQWCKVCAYIQDRCGETCAKCVRKDYLSCVLFANVVNFVLFAGVLCERCRTCVVCCTFLEFPGFTPSVLVMGADSANFA